MISLSRRLTVAIVTLVAASVGIPSIGVWVAARWHAIAILDTSLDEHALALSYMLARHGGRPPPRADPPPPPLRSAGGAQFAEIIEGDGGVSVFRSRTMDDQPIPLPALLAGTRDGDKVWLTLADGRRLRALVARPLGLTSLPIPGPSSTIGGAGPAPAVPGDGESPNKPLRLLVAHDASGEMAELTRLAMLLTAVWVAASGTGLIAAWSVRRTILRPVHRLAEAIGAVDPERLPTNLSVQVPIEMAIVPARLDELLRRLGAVIEREKRTIADIAHELRTPIAALRTTLEFALAAPGGGLGRADAERLLGVAIGMQALVANLLILTRLEAGLEKVAPINVDLADLVSNALDTLAERAAARRLRIEAPDDGPPPFATSREHARLVVQNLLDNAVSHATPGSAISVTWRRGYGSTTLVIANPTTAAPLPPDHQFRPFWRDDAARAGDGLHCGLGLALCQRLTTLLRGTLVVAADQPGRFLVSFTLPEAWPS